MDDDSWNDKTKKQKQDYIQCAQALYSVRTIPVKPIAKKRRKAKRSPSDPCSPSESLIQTRLVAWMRSEDIPHFSIPNHGKRSRIGGHIQVSMGLLKGASDVFLFRASGGYHGYFIELKTKGKKPTVEQYQFMDRAKAEGFKADWYDNLDDAKNAVKNYLCL